MEREAQAEGPQTLPALPPTQDPCDNVHEDKLAPLTCPIQAPSHALTQAHADDEGVLGGLEELVGHDAAADEHLALADRELVGGQLEQLVLCDAGRER